LTNDAVGGAGAGHWRGHSDRSENNSKSPAEATCNRPRVARPNAGGTDRRAQDDAACT
jgi:hypothetical protein